MINSALYKRGIKTTWKMWLIFGAILTMYFSIIASMYDPKLGVALQEFEKAMPGLMSMVGMTTSDTTLISHMSAYLYGFVILIFPMLFSIICANGLIAKYVDRGSMTYLLNAQVNRKTVAFTQINVLETGILILVLVATAVGLISCQANFAGELDIPKFLLLNLGALCLHLFIGSVCFMCSCIFSDTKYSIGFGAGIPVAGFVLQMIANYGDKYENLKYASFFTLFNPDEIVSGETSAYIGMAVLFVMAVVLFSTSVVIFNKKDLHI